MRLKFLISLCAAPLGILLSCCAANADNGERPVPISVSILCARDTPSVYRIEYGRSLGAQPDVPSTECVDMRESISYIKPNDINVEFQTHIRLWAVVIVLNEKDASRVKSLVGRNFGKFMIVGVNKMTLSTPFVMAPMEDNKIYIGVNSERDGEELKRYLVEQGSGSKQ
ncbi:hypothetical protein ACGY7B_04555 [Burkholderia pseudomallei]|nr:hypothetical protein [Burkholderia pseudomallei]MBF3619386.1 hypothetical protein [Burkholderia pseudomallei]